MGQPKNPVNVGAVVGGALQGGGGALLASSLDVPATPTISTGTFTTGAVIAAAAVGAGLLFVVTRKR